MEDEIKLPESKGSEDLERPEPAMLERGEIEVPEHPLQEEGEIKIDEEHLGFWLIAASALLVLLIERQKSKRPAIV